MDRKTVLITGASSGIGKSCALYFHEKGWNVAATMRNPQKVSELANLPHCRLFTLDVTDESSIENAIRGAVAVFGKIDVLVNNAGYGAVGIFEASKASQIEQQFSTNVFGLMNVTKAVIPFMRETNGGTIINIASIAGRLAFPLYSIYHASKWAVEGFSESLAYELRQFNIKIKIIEPGAIRTDFYSRSQDLFKKEGLECYDSFVETVFPAMQKIGFNAQGPLIVAKKIYIAATDNSRKLRYPIGGGAPILLFIRKFIPDSVFSYIIRKKMGI